MLATEVIMEQFKLDPLSNLIDDNFFNNYFEDGNSFINSLLSEATNSQVKKKDLFRKLCGIIKKIFEWIAKQWNRFTTFIRRLFTRKSKSVDQIMEEAIPSVAASAKSNKSPSNNTSSNNDASNNDVRSNNNVSNNDVNSIKIEFNPEVSEGAPSVNTIELAHKDLTCKIENDTIIFYPNKIRGGAENQMPEYRVYSGMKDYVPAHGRPMAAWNGALMIYLLIDKPEYMSLFNRIINQLDEKTWEQGVFNATTFSNDVTSLTNALLGHITVQNSFGLTISQINSFNEALTNFNKSFSFYDDPNANPGGDNPLVVKALNKLADLAFRLQFGVTLITGSMSKIHEIDAKYIGIVNDNESLSKFVEGCIKGDVPSKYIAFNAFAVCSEDMRGDADQMRPKMGQSRLALFPRNKNVVTKIAINQYGVRANNAELMVYNALKKHNYEQLIARVEDASDNKCVISMEKADTNFNKNSYEVQAAINNLSDQLRQASNAAGLKINITDIHAGNIGKRGNKWISIDYGFTER